MRGPSFKPIPLRGQFLAFFAIPMALVSCADLDGEAPTQPALKLVSAPDLTPDNLVLSVENENDAAICIPTVTELTSENLSLSQGGVRIHPRAGDRQVMAWRSADLAAGMTVVPPGESIDVFFYLGHWPLAAEATRANLKVRWIECAEFFTEEHPSFGQVEVGLSFQR